MTKIQPVRGRQSARVRLSDDQLQYFRKICSQETDESQYPTCVTVLQNVVIYDGESLRSGRILEDSDERNCLLEELHHCLLEGPGVFVVRNAMQSSEMIDQANVVLRGIVEKEKASGISKGDHFAAAGTNDRVWNYLQKHAEVDPENFVEYYSNEMIALASEAWLGPGYQITSQANIVKPGGKAQRPHRDYHLGFQSAETASRFPIASQVASQLLTLQMAIAHTDMPVESGPTLLLPHSQKLQTGFLAYRHQPFADIFHEQRIQLPLKKGDMLCFSPALFHAAGDNRTADFDRIANLIQVSACWSKTMETVDRDTILRGIWPELKLFVKGHGLDSAQSHSILAAVCDDYSFPTNLDKDPPPANGHCPETQLQWITKAIKGDATTDQLRSLIEDYRARRTS